MNEIKRQPPTPMGRPKGSSNFQSGGKRSINRLDALKFDPIKEIVDKYRKLEQELKYQEDFRDNRIVPLTSTGRVRTYNPEIHMNIYDKLLNTGEKLLRYYYGRVPEVALAEEKQISPLIVNLTREGDVYQIGREIESMVSDEHN